MKILSNTFNTMIHNDIAMHDFIYFRIYMHLKMIPIQFRLSLLVTVEIPVPFLRARLVLFRKDLWAYAAPTISAKIVDTRKKENDNSPPQITDFVDGLFNVIYLVNPVQHQ